MMAFYILTLFKKKVLARIAMLAEKNYSPPTKRLCASNLLGDLCLITDIYRGLDQGSMIEQATLNTD
jgi:hypothetical protein